MIAFCPLYQGLLTNKYLQGVPKGSRADVAPQFLREGELTEDVLKVIAGLNEIAEAREQSLAQMAISWILRLPQITSVLCGASSPEQIVENCKAIQNKEFSPEELRQIVRLVSDVELPPSLWDREEN